MDTTTKFLRDTGCLFVLNLVFFGLELIEIPPKIKALASLGFCRLDRYWNMPIARDWATLNSYITRGSITWHGAFGMGNSIAMADRIRVYLFLGFWVFGFGNWGIMN